MAHVFTNSRNALILQKLELLRQARNGIIARLFGYRLVPMKTALYLKAAIVLAYIGLVCLIPLLTPDDLETATKVGQGLVHYHHLIINGGALFLFYLGLFVGAVQIAGLNVAENEQLLSYPLVLSDLVLHRAMDAWRVIIKASIYFVLPCMVLLSVALGWSSPWTIAMTALTTIFMTAVYLAGVNLALAIINRIPNRRTEAILGGILLISCIVLVVAVRSFKAGYFGPGDVKLWVWLNQQLALGSYTSMMDNMILQPWGIGQFVLCLLAGAGLLYYLVQMCVRSFGRAFQRIHAQAYDMTGQAQRDALKIGFAALNRRMRWLPLDVRTLLAKDVLNLLRRPHLLVKSVVFAGALVFIAYWNTSLLDDPFVFALYVSSTLVISRLFLNIIGHERGNILLIKQLYPSAWSYLSGRVKIAIVVSCFILIPFWSVLIALSAEATMLDGLARSPLLLLNITLTSILVIFCSAAFAEFNPERFGKQDIGVHPMAMMGVYGIGMMLTLFSYKLDLALLSDGADNLTLVFLIVTGLFLTIGMFILRWIGIRRITHYA